MSISYRLYEPGDFEQTVNLIQRVFKVIAPVPLESWVKMETTNHITVLAEDGDKVIGTIPFALRDFLIRPGVSIRAAFAHNVAVDAAYRKQGVGSGIMKLAREMLPDVSDGMFVYTGEEGRAPYTFYERNGFVDLHYSRFFTLTNSHFEAPGEVEIKPIEPVTLDEEMLNEAYHRVYHEYAGFPPRFPGYWKEALNSIIFVEFPYDFQLATIKQGSGLAGYAIFGYSKDSAVILEMVADPHKELVVDNLFKGIISAANSHGAHKVKMVAAYHHPAAPAMVKLGFQPIKRTYANVTSGQVFHFDKLWSKLAGENHGMALRIWTPEWEFELPGEGPIVSLEMKTSTLHRLFLCREDVRAALQTERITSTTYPLPIEHLQQLFGRAPWVHHWLEWI